MKVYLIKTLEIVFVVTPRTLLSARLIDGATIRDVHPRNTITRHR